MKQQTNPWNKIVGENIRRLREENNETQAMLGEFLGYGATTVANYESGYRLPDLLTAYVIAQHYHVLLDELTILYKGVKYNKQSIEDAV